MPAPAVGIYEKKKWRMQLTGKRTRRARRNGEKGETEGWGEKVEGRKKKNKRGAISHMTRSHSPEPVMSLLVTVTGTD